MDDDLSMRAKMKRSNKDTMTKNNLPELLHVFDKDGKKKILPNKGSVPIYMSEPTFVADPNHWKKSFTSELHHLEGSGVDAKAGMRQCLLTG